MTIVVRTNEPVIETPKDTTQKGETAPTTASDDTKSAPEATSEQNEEASTDSDTEDKETTTEAKEETEGSSDDESGKPEETEAEKDDEKPKKKGGFQRRIDKLSARNAAAQQELEYWRNLATKSAGGEAKKEPTTVDTRAATKADAGAPDPEKFDTHAEYVQALTDWKVEQKLNERDQKAAKSRIETEQQSKFKAHYAREKSFSDKTEDYAEVMEDANYLKDASATLQQILIESDNGPELMYELAKNKAEYDRINGLPAIAAARELGKFESKLSKASTTESKQETKTITNAPAPLAPVGSGKGSAKKSIFDPNLSQDEYERLRAEQMKRKGA